MLCVYRMVLFTVVRRNKYTTDPQENPKARHDDLGIQPITFITEMVS